MWVEDADLRNMELCDIVGNYWCFLVVCVLYYAAANPTIGTHMLYSQLTIVM